MSELFLQTNIDELALLVSAVVMAGFVLARGYVESKRKRRLDWSKRQARLDRVRGVGC